MLVIKLIIESLRFAVKALVINKVRTFLSLLGITIGIFSIISVFTVFDSLEYEIIITDIGFETYLNTIAKPENFYSQEFYENKNRFYVTEWNIRAQNPLRYRSDIYENQIDYDFNVDYGLEVNYKLYNYFKFIEYKYNQRFF